MSPVSEILDKRRSPEPPSFSRDLVLKRLLNVGE